MELHAEIQVKPGLEHAKVHILIERDLGPNQIGEVGEEEAKEFLAAFNFPKAQDICEYQGEIVVVKGWSFNWFAQYDVPIVEGVEEREFEANCFELKVLK